MCAPARNLHDLKWVSAEPITCGFEADLFSVSASRQDRGPTIFVLLSGQVFADVHLMHGGLAATCLPLRHLIHEGK